MIEIHIDIVVDNAVIIPVDIIEVNKE